MRSLLDIGNGLRSKSSSRMTSFVCFDRINSFDPPPARVFGRRVLELKEQGVHEKAAISVALVCISFLLGSWAKILRNINSVSCFLWIVCLLSPFSRSKQPFSLEFRWNIGRRKKLKWWHILDWGKLLFFKGRNRLLTRILSLSTWHRLKRGNLFATIPFLSPRYMKLQRRWEAGKGA